MENKANSSIAENNEYSSPEAAILWNCEANDGWITLPAFQFLWQYLTDDERMQIIIKRCRVLKNFLSYALCNLDEKQLDCVVESNAAQILIILFHESQTVFMLLWNHVKSRNIITVSSFFEIMLHLVQNGAPLGYTAAFDVWISASDELRKETVISQNADILLKRLLKTHSLLDIRNVPGETRLLMELLSAYPSEKRETIWNELWENIIFGTPVEYMQMVMKRCLGCDDKICKFKKMYLCKYSEIGRYLRYLLYCNGFQTLNMFLSFKSFITDDTEIIRDLRINLMKSVHFFDGYFSAFKSGSAKEIATFDKFIDETLSDASQLEDFKKYLIIREDPSHHVFKRTMMDGEFNSNIPGFCDHVLSSMPHLLNQVKNMLLEYCYDAVDYACFGHESTSHFTDWEKTVMWCLNEDIHLLEKFKRRFDVNSVFWMWINKCMRELKTMNLELCVDENGVFRNCYFEALQCLLRWLLEDSGKILDLKRDEFETVRLSKKYKFLLKSNKQPQIDALRKWFFHIDDVNVYYSDNFEASLFEECVD
ncbi:uncharacterized protein LOC135846275 [Planococcus citri]|uniref:uncharacterized protein LOC135846275 n=1 Tax=Planococcus citri TaxID=170843 RepID=UPI0031F8488A